MCLICTSLGIPVCNGVACTPQALDFVKIFIMTGGAGSGLAVTLLKLNEKKSKIKKEND